MVPAHSPPASVIRSEPFIRPTNQPASQASDRPSASTTTNPLTSRSQSDRHQLSDRPAASDRPSTSISSAFQPTRKNSSSESDSDGVVSDRPPVDIFVEEGELLDELDATVTDPFYCVNTSYLVDRCICPALCRSRQTLEKNVLSWALAGTGSVLFIHQVAV